MFSLNLLAQGGQGLLEEGSALNPVDGPPTREGPYSYSETQIVGGLIFDVIVSLILLGWLFWIGWRTYGPPNQWFGGRTKAHPAGPS